MELQNRIKLLWSVILILCSSLLGKTEIIINEVLASNTLTLADPTFGNYGDWVELHNAGTDTVNLLGYEIADKSDFSKKFIFSDYKMAPHSFLVVWADGDSLDINESVTYDWNGITGVAQAFHTNFKLKKSGEGVFLRNDKGTLIDSLVYDSQITDVSLSRGSTTLKWGYSGSPTPGASNGDECPQNFQFSSDVSFSHPSGYCASPINVTLSSEESSGVVYYTLDGSRPTIHDAVYSSPLAVTQNSTIRSMVIEQGKLAGRVATANYFFSKPSLSFFHITIGENDLWNEHWGIYETSRKDHQVPAKLEYFNEEGGVEFELQAGVKLFGSTIFQLAQKPFSITIHNKYGDEILEYPLFKDKRIGTYKEFVLRNGGNDFYQTMFRDGFTATLGSEMSHIQYQAYKPVAVYLNGDYWGLYNVREKMNEHYLESNYGVSPDRVDLLEEFEEKEGSLDDFNRLLNFVSSNQITEEDYQSVVKEWIDVDAFMDHIILKSYLGYSEVTVNNKAWRSHDKGKWNWLSFDMEHGFGCCGSDLSTKNTLEKYLESTLSQHPYVIFRELFKVDAFKKEFLQRYNLYLETVLSKDHVIEVIDSLSENIQSEIFPHLQRWRPTFDFSDWVEEVDALRSYAIERTPAMKSMIKDYLSKDESHQLGIQLQGKGMVQVNGVEVHAKNWSSEVFAQSELVIKAIPEAGYRFTAWNNGSSAEVLTWLPNKDSVFVANFELDPMSFGGHVVHHLIFDDTTKIYTISSDLIIQQDASLTVKKGVQIEFYDHTNLVVHGTLRMEGTQDYPISLSAQNEFWGNVYLENAQDTVEFHYVNIENAHRGYQDGESAIASFGSNLVVSHCSITNSRQPIYTQGGNVLIEHSLFHMDMVGDLINITKTNEAQVLNCEFRGNREQDTDAIDYDGVTNGVIKGNWIYGFRGYNSDGIDLGESSKNILIEDNEIYYCSDKGISVGQASTAVIKNNLITLCGMGVGVKDHGASAHVSYNTLDANKHALAAFEKNPGAGGGSIYEDHNLLTNSDGSTYLKDDKSILESHNSLAEGVKYSNPSFFDFKILESDSLIGSSLSYHENRHPKVLINEINYNPGDSCPEEEEWVEFFSVDDSIQSLSGWMFGEGGKFHEILEGDLMMTNSIAVLNKVPAVWTNNPRYNGFEYPFKLSNEGERLCLFNGKGMVVNSVFYRVEDEWPMNNSKPIGLKTEAFHNTRGQNWKSSADCSGSKGNSNNIQNFTIHPSRHQIFQVFPNPTTGVIHWEKAVDYEVFTVMGQQVESGYGNSIDFSDQTAGMYIIKTSKGITRIVRQ